MKTRQIKISKLTVLKTYAIKTLPVVMLSVFIFCALNIYAFDKPNRKNNNNLNSSLELITLKGHYENQSDLLNWEVVNSSPVAYFTIEYANSSDMLFNEVATLNPAECADLNKNSNYNFKCVTDAGQEIAYYKITATFQDNHTIVSNYISIKKSEPVSNLFISGIKRNNDKITVTFKSPKTQNITLNILNNNGQLIAANTVEANAGSNTFTFDTEFLKSTELLIFNLNNQSEQITKKYLFASAW